MAATNHSAESSAVSEVFAASEASKTSGAAELTEATESGAAPHPQRARLSGSVGLWLGGLVIWGTALTWCTGYRLHDADSRLYVALAKDLSQQPYVLWCAPQWGGHWGRMGLFVEHPPGLFWAGAWLIEVGLSPYVALYVVNQSAWLLGLWLLFALGARLANRRAAALAVAIWGVSPAFVQYLVRGDQEHPLATSVLLGFVAAACVQRPWAAGVVWAAALSFAWSFKGLPALALLPLGFGLAWAQRRSWAVLAAMGLGSLLAAAGVWLFDVWYDAQTGHSFMRAYVQVQITPSVGHGFFWAQKGVNLVYYLARPLWFAQPAVGLVLYGLWRRRRGSKANLRSFGGHGFFLGVGALTLFVAAFSLANRKADRYLFAAYPLVALSAAIQLETLGGRAQALSAAWLRRPRTTVALGAAVLMVAVGLKVYLGTYHYVFVRWWPGA